MNIYGKLKKRKVHFYHQHESIDCGPACLAMVASAHGKMYSVGQVKQICSITRMGVSVQDIIRGGKEMGFDTTGLKLKLRQLEEIPLPAILFWKQDHFVVLTAISKKKDNISYHLADPGYGRVVLDEEIVVREWMGNNDSGVAILLQPNDSDHMKSGIILPALKKKNAIFRLVGRFLSENKARYLWSFILLGAAFVFSCFMPFIFKRIIDEGIVNKSFQVVWILLAAQFGFFLGNFISSTVSNWILTRVNFKMSILLKRNLLYKLLLLPISYFDTRLNTDTLQRLGDQGKIQSFLTWKSIDLAFSAITILVFGIMLAVQNIWVFGVYLVLALLAAVWIGVFLKKRRILEYALFLRQSENSNSTYEFIMHMPEIKINGAQSKLIEKLVKIQAKLNTIELRSLFLNIYQITGVGFLGKLREVVTVAVCAYFIINNQMTIGGLMGITYILGQLTGPTQNMVYFVRDLQDARIAGDRVNDIYNETDENINVVQRLPQENSDIMLNEISFKYPGSFNPFVIDQISFCIPGNKVTAIIGPSGSGKTTLLKLLLSYYTPVGGAITINEKNLSDLDTDRWRNECGVVLQDGHIFGGTIADNIALSDTEPEMIRIRSAAAIACIDSFIDELPMGYHTKIGSVGIQLSGGQKQRLLIARAVYKNPKYIFFDEATSSLDANNERQIMENLDAFFKGRTVVVIAHRLSTVKNADQIIVMERGSIVETGDHNSLTRARGKYFDLVKNQLELGT